MAPGKPQPKPEIDDVREAILGILNVARRFERIDERGDGDHPLKPYVDRVRQAYFETDATLLRRVVRHYQAHKKAIHDMGRDRIAVDMAYALSERIEHARDVAPESGWEHGRALVGHWVRRSFDAYGYEVDAESLRQALSLLDDEYITRCGGAVKTAQQILLRISWRGGKSERTFDQRTKALLDKPNPLMTPFEQMKAVDLRNSGEHRLDILESSTDVLHAHDYLLRIAGEPPGFGEQLLRKVKKAFADAWTDLLSRRKSS